MLKQVPTADVNASSEIGCEPSSESLISPSLRRSAPSPRSYEPLDPSEVTGLWCFAQSDLTFQGPDNPA
jgi:hypothetical protein